MIISHKYKFVFMHNPKVAGSAIRKALAPFHDDPETFWHQKYFAQLDRVVDAAHLTVHDLRLVRPHVFGNGYTFLTIYRNPYDRFASSLGEFMRQHEDAYPGQYFTADEWCHQYADETNFRFNWKYIHFCPQHYFAMEPGNGNHASHVAHERLGSAWEGICMKLGIEFVPLPSVRVRPDAPGTLKGANLSPSVRGYINRIYNEDFEMFDQFDLKDGWKNEPSTHYERVNAIHSPYFAWPDPNTLTTGEKIAYEQRKAAQYPKNVV